MTRRGGRPFAGVVAGGEVLVPVREGEDTARLRVAARRKMHVRLRGRSYAMVPTSVMVDDADGVWVSADEDDLAPWA